MLVGERLKECIDRANTSQSALAREIGVSPQAVSKMVGGGTAESPKLHRIARFLRTTPEYLTGETDDPSPSALVDRQMAWQGPEREDMVEIASVDLALGMGASFLDNDSPDVEMLEFPRSYVQLFTETPPEMLFIARAVNDSMEPTIRDREPVWIDRSERTIRIRDGVFACAMGDVGMIKRLRPKSDGTIQILSDNPNVPDDYAALDELHLLGRVVGLVRRL